VKTARIKITVEGVSQEDGAAIAERLDITDFNVDDNVFTAEAVLDMRNDTTTREFTAEIKFDVDIALARAVKTTVEWL
jgi:hypothetical protein